MSATASPVLPIQIREYTPDDLGFIVQAWIRGYQRSSEVADLKGPEYSPYQRAQIDRLLKRGRALVAVNALSPAQNFGFVVFENEPKVSVSVIHYVYVKSVFRQLGFGRALLTEATNGSSTIFYTHRAPRREDEKVLRRGGARFNPYLR